MWVQAQILVTDHYLCVSSGFQEAQGCKVHVRGTERPEARICGQRVRGGGFLQTAVQEPRHRSDQNRNDQKTCGSGLG